MNLNDTISQSGMSGRIRIYQQDDPTQVLYEDHNVICLQVKYLFARMMMNSKEPLFGVWGLALGAGAPDWPVNSQPDPTAAQKRIITPLLRKACTWKRFVDADLNTIANNGYSNLVDFQTIINATTDGIGTPIRELGLIAGGTTGTDPLTADWFDASTQDGINATDHAILLNYKTLPPLRLPEGVNFILSWLITF